TGRLLKSLKAPLDALAPAAGEKRVVLPPVDSHLARLVGRGDEQAQPDRQELDVEQVDLDVARDDDALVEHALEHVGELGRLPSPRQARGNSLGRTRRKAHPSSSTCARW